jgi:hypothetical protein
MELCGRGFPFLSSITLCWLGYSMCRMVRCVRRLDGTRAILSICPWVGLITDREEELGLMDTSQVTEGTLEILTETSEFILILEGFRDIARDRGRKVNHWGAGANDQQADPHRAWQQANPHRAWL